jgi:pyruvate/2-oxoglutarate dehydrogenase complex dihydrolipoamide acyltransferase (E2) component
MLAIRHRLWANVAIDHRTADGETGGRFLAALERRLDELPATI